MTAHTAMLQWRWLNLHKQNQERSPCIVARLADLSQFFRADSRSFSSSASCCKRVVWAPQSLDRLCPGSGSPRNDGTNSGGCNPTLGLPPADSRSGRPWPTRCRGSSRGGPCSLVCSTPAVGSPSPRGVRVCCSFHSRKYCTVSGCFPDGPPPRRPASAAGRLVSNGSINGSSRS